MHLNKLKNELQESDCDDVKVKRSKVENRENRRNYTFEIVAHIWRLGSKIIVSKVLKHAGNDSERFRAVWDLWKKSSKSTQNWTPKWPKSRLRVKGSVSWIGILTAQCQRNLKTIVKALNWSLDVLRLPRYKTNKGLFYIIVVEGHFCYWCSQS